MSSAPPISAQLGSAAARLQQLQQDGFCVVPEMAGAALLDRTRRCVRRAVAAQDAERLARNRSPGTLIDSGDYPELADLVGNPKALRALDDMGLTDCRFWKAVIISKPPGGPLLYWHQDCMMWQDPRAYSDWSPMVFLMYYLEDTSRHNGCLRVLPGSHRRRHELHAMGEAHTPDINRMDNLEDPRFRSYAGELDVPVTAGDLVIGDARMFHASHANQSAQWRTVITIWFHPRYRDLQERTRSWIHEQMHRRHADWPAQALAKIEPVVPRYTGSAAPMEVQRTAGPRLT